MVARGVLLLGILALSLAAGARTLTVLAAASLREACTEMAKEFEASHPGDHVRMSFAGSQQLAASILLDAPADVFMSADEAQMARVVKAGKARHPSHLCSNRLVIVVPKASASRVPSLTDLGWKGLRLVLAKHEVPAGAYADQIIAKLPPTRADAIRANIRSREPDVRTVLMRVAMGEADAGIVYATDVVAGQNRVQGVLIPEKYQTPVLYLVAALTKSEQPALASAFVKLAIGSKGQAILHAHGFLPPPRPKAVRWRWSAVLAAPFLLFLAAPIVALVVSTPSDALVKAAARLETIQALGVSARTTSVTILVLVLLATPLAWLVGRSRGRLTKAIETLIELPAVLPPSVAGIALLVAFGHAGIVGRHLPFEIPFTALAVILAQLFVASPFFLRPAAEGFRTLEPDMMDAARLDGAGHVALGVHIVWPSVRPAYVGALCLAWARALGEFGATLLFAGSFAGTTQTAPLAIYDAFESDLDAAKALGVVLLVVAFIVLGLAKLVARPARN